MRALDRKLLRDLKQLWGPGLAIAGVMACGVATAVLMFGTMRSLDETRQAYYERYRFAHVFAGLKRAPQRLLSEIEAISGVSAAQSRIVVDVIVDVPDMPEPARGRLISVPETGEPRLNALALMRGRWIRSDAPEEVIVNVNFAEAHGFDLGSSFSALINGRKRDLRIVGLALSPEYIYASGPGQLVPDDRTFGIVWMGRSALEAAYDLKGAFNDVSVTLTRSANQADVIDQIDEILKPYGGVGAFSRAVQFSNLFVENELKQLNTFGQIVPPLFLAVAGFLLNIVINRLVERERESIGLLKAFGYRNLEVGAHFAKLVLAVSSVGVVLGLLLGLWMGRALTELYADFFRFPFLYYRVDTQVFAAAAAISFGAALIGALQSIRKAVGLEPAVAMRPAPPPVYRRTALERLGLAHLVSEPSRMVLRHIERWPIRSAMTTVGISFSVALLVVTLFPLSAVEHVIDVYYFQSQRQDATIAFVEPRNAFASTGIMHMPAVMKAEGYRSVPATVSFEQFEERISIIGINPDADINRLLDANLRPITAPPNGIVLSTYLADLLRTRPGDVVTAEVMIGRRPTERLQVMSIAEEYIGFNAYMDVNALNRLMRDDDVVSGFHIAIDDLAALDLYREVKNTPSIAGLNLKSSVLKSFRETIAETIEISMVFYIGFAGAIAFGIAYNSARIGFAERQRELASLRVMGFTRGEVGFILLGELIILGLIALPLGCLFGFGMAYGIVASFQTDIIRLPLHVTPQTFAIAMAVALIAVVVSSLMVARRIRSLDLVGVLKTRD